MFFTNLEFCELKSHLDLTFETHPEYTSRDICSKFGSDDEDVNGEEEELTFSQAF